MKRLLTMLLLLVVVNAPAAIKYYDDYPHNPTPPDTYILSLQTLDKSVGGTPYNYWTLGDMTSWLQVMGFTNGSSSINIITNNNFTYSTNIVVENITNTTLVNTNTLIVTSNAFFNNTYVTNITVEVPGGMTNLNLTPNSLMQSDANDAESSVPNGTGVLTNDGAGGFGWTTVVALTGNFIQDNNGNGTNTTLWGTTIFDELDVDNAYFTNLFLLLTNAPFLATDGDGKVIAGSGTITNDTTIVQNFSATYITNLTEYSTNLFITTNFTDVSYTTNLYTTNLTVLTNNTFISYVTNLFVTTNITDTAYITNLYTTNITAKNLTVNNFYALGAAVDNLTVTNGITNVALSASQFVATDANKKLVSTLDGSTLTKVPTAVTNEVTRQINSATNIYASLGTAISDLSLGTNLTYKYTTNIVGAANFVFGKAYWTNITGNFTFPALTMQDSAAMETMVVMVTNSGASTFTATINGVSGGPAHAIPSVFYCTNAAVTEIDVKHFGVLWTNAMSQ